MGPWPCDKFSDDDLGSGWGTETQGDSLGPGSTLVFCKYGVLESGLLWSSQTPSEFLESSMPSGLQSELSALKYSRAMARPTDLQQRDQVPLKAGDRHHNPGDISSVASRNRQPWKRLLSLTDEVVKSVAT